MAIGLSRDGRSLTLFTVDVRGGYEGMWVGEGADVLMKDYGVWNALNLDGGGSMSMCDAQSLLSAEGLAFPAPPTAALDY